MPDQSVFVKAEIATLGDDRVIRYLDAQKLSGLDAPFRGCLVHFRKFRDTFRVVVYEHDMGRLVDHCCSLLACTRSS